MYTERKLAAFSAGILAALISSTSSQAQAAESFAQAFTAGKASISFRYRLEHVDQDNFAKDALASTLRGRLHFKTDDWKGFGLVAEMDYVAEVGWNNFNAGAGNTPGRTQYPVVADPDGPDLNQAYLYWKPATGSEIRAGRQRIIFDNSRFVGNVGWRQNEQTFDAVSYRFKNQSGIDLQIAYLDKVNRIFGRDVPAGQHDQATWLGNIARNWENIGKLSAYYHVIDNQDAAAFSTITYGLRFTGQHKVGASTLGYTVEYAQQKDHANNAVDYTASYWRFDLSASFGSTTPYFAYESLGGDDTRSGAMFRTPLATLHAFNGWADKFLATPAAGLSDFMLGVKGKAKSWKWNLVYHDFEAESGDASYGSELDAVLSTKFAGHYGVLFKAAWFDASGTSGLDDTFKLWAQLTASF